MIVIVDYGVGNTGSIANMLEHIGYESIVTRDPALLKSARRLILPGVGAFDRAMEKLEETGLIPILDRLALEDRIPILGVCLGMQLLADSSEEGSRRGLGWIRGRSRRIASPSSNPVKVPHIGWAQTECPRPSPLFPDVGEENRFYFVHSYHVVCEDQGAVAATIEYGQKLTAAVSVGNIHGVQFHPEKSHRFGMRLLQRFAEAH